MIKKIIIATLCLALVLGAICFSFLGSPLKIVASDGSPVAQPKSIKAISKDQNSAYLKIVFDEAVDILASINNCDKKEAGKQLFKGEYTIFTAFDPQINQKLSAACSPYDRVTTVGSAVTDLSGNLVAVYSTDSKDDTNYATLKTNPCSAFKPISVYAPAIDSGKINWSSRYEDSPYKKVLNQDGALRDWPKNAGNYYTKRYLYIFQAVKESTNTVAVKCLADLGVDYSISFLEKNFGIPLSDEKSKSDIGGPDEVIGNIALGSLHEGVTPVNMAGYYQIFASGGKYTEPKTILKICDASGKEIYIRKPETKSVIKGSTAELMNHILKGVLEVDGTGNKAAVNGIEIAGKTGTDETNANNWFVGVTPQYSCSVWHADSQKNNAPEIFSNVIKGIYEAKPQAAKTFSYSQGLMNVAYCTETGKMAGAGCTLIRSGYYTFGNVPGPCDRH